MRRTPTLLLAMLLIIASANTTAAMLVEDAGEISYQVPRADRIVTGTVTTQAFYDYTIVTIEVDCWLKNPLPAKAITVRTECGTGVRTEDEASFALNETAILMLEDVNTSENRFKMVCGEVGKHPPCQREAQF